GLAALLIKAQPLNKSGGPRGPGGCCGDPQIADGRELARLLRAHREWPRCGGAEQRDELAPLHSITSSAVPSSVAGTSSPSTLAVCRLMTTSNFAARIPGRSAGFSPLTMRPA